MGALRGLECSGCRAWYDSDRLSAVCPECNSPLLARYDLDELRGRLTPEKVAGRPSGIWRWSELLPASEGMGRALSLGEGETAETGAARAAALASPTGESVSPMLDVLKRVNRADG